MLGAFPTTALAGYEDGMDAYRKAWAAYATQRYDEARRWDKQAIQADPKNPHAYALAGDLAYLAHDLDGARKAWEQSLALEPRLRAIMERLSQLAREQALETGQVALNTDLFVIRTPAPPPKDLVGGPAGAEIDTPWVLRELQAAKTFLETQWQFQLRGPISVLVYTPEAFYDGFHVPTAVAGLFDGKIRLPVSGRAGARDLSNDPQRQGGQGQAQQADEVRRATMRPVIWHELTHAAVHQLTHGRAPRWLHEGVAQAVEAHVRSIPTEALQLALRRDAVPALAKLEGRSGEFGEATPIEAGVFYQASFAYVAYVLDHRGWAGLHRLLDEVRDGVPTPDALAHVMGMDEREWDRESRRWVQEHFESP